MPDTVCVAMAACDGARYLPEQLASIAAQTRLPDRMVVADDASTDATPEIVADFAAAAAFPVELYAHPDRLGPAGNFGRALAASTDEIPLPADQDDRWHPEKIAVLEDAMFGDPELNLVFSDLDLVDVGGHPLGESQWDRLGFGPAETLLMMTGHERVAALSGMVAAAANVVLNAVLIPLCGIEGAAIATAVSGVVWAATLNQVAAHGVVDPGPFRRV